MNQHRVHSLSNGVTRIAVRLVAHRHHSGRSWCLSWDFGDGTGIGAEGECSRQLFKNARGARAYGERNYGERAVIKGSW